MSALLCVLKNEIAHLENRRKIVRCDLDYEFSEGITGLKAL